MIEEKKTENETEERILNFLTVNGPSNYGDILKSLKLSYRKGQAHVTNLKSKGLIKNTRESLKIEANI